MKSLSRAAVLFAAGFLLCTSNVMAEGVGGGGRSSSKSGSGSGGDSSYYLLGTKRTPEMEYIYEHYRDLGITPDQKQKLENLQMKIDAARDKALKSAPMREVYKEMVSYKKEGEDDKFREVRDKARDMVAKMGAGDEFKDQYANILTPEQLAKVKDGMSKSDKKMADKGERGDRGDREKADREREKEKVAETKKVDPNKTPSLFDDK